MFFSLSFDFLSWILFLFLFHDDIVADLPLYAKCMDDIGIQIGDEGARQILDAFRENSTLLHLDIGSERFSFSFSFDFLSWIVYLYSSCCCCCSWRYCVVRDVYR